MKIVRVALDVPLPRLFDYLPGDCAESHRGQLVHVPFGAVSRVGIVVGEGVADGHDSGKLKTVAGPVGDAPTMPEEWLTQCEFVARYYQAPLGEVMFGALPPTLRRGKMPRRAAAKAKRADPAAVPASGAPAEPPALPALLPAQAAAIEAIAHCTGYATLLLHGVTGSGKTEVYLRAIARVLAAGGQALMLVPEIALTPQLMGRVAARFPGARIVAAHSGVADAARTRAFLDAMDGRADIVLGTRLAVFMPLPRLALIVVDEEHDASFKQQEGVRYSARDLAIWRARQRDVPVVLGSATPALESWHHARCGRYRMLELPDRALAEAMPRVRLIDTRRLKLADGLSPALEDAIERRLGAGEQSLIFLNRRGYAPVLACPACGWISHCPSCAANLVVHLADRRLRCHHCGREATIPRHCPDCGNLDLQPFGRGTQRLEARLAARFPLARILRIDRDSASTPAKWAALLASIHAGEADILVGTQMLAKGHDFPLLTLVGAVGADAALFAADYRAPERLFAQLMQVGGRSGRAALPGEVFIQTEYPDHALYRALIDHDYVRFAEHLLGERETAGCPPFSHQALLLAHGREMAQALDFLRAAREAAERVVAGRDAVICYDPVPMRMSRLKTLERAQLLVESTQRGALQAFLAEWMPALYALKVPAGLRWHLDVDPLEL